METHNSFIDKDELLYYDSPLSNFLACGDQSILLRQHPFDALTSVVFWRPFLKLFFINESPVASLATSTPFSDRAPSGSAITNS